MEEQERRIRRKYRAKILGTGIATSLASAALMASTMWASFEIAYCNTQRNPYKERRAVTEYSQMENTLERLTSMQETTETSDSPERSPYIPEGMEEDRALLFTNIKKSKIRKEKIDNYISRVKADMKKIETSSDYQFYKHWNDEHFTLDDSNRIFLQGQVLPVTLGIGIICLGTGIISRQRKRMNAELDVYMCGAQNTQ